MKLLILPMLACLFCSAPKPTLSNAELLAEIYEGNFSLAHKVLLTHKSISDEDELFHRFIMAYFQYKLGYLENIEITFEEIDRFLEEKSPSH